MYLKSIELENFKSFGGKITIPLMDGYMAVTGPNGSGKSNIGDAIMFVLGPRSPKAVRAARIPDLVFNSSSKGKADHMTATLVFENKDRILPWDADEVRLTRYIKLKGENKDDYVSYFYINDQSARLSDFEALLSKARISADGYNIVQQGDVTHIIQMGAVERRRILDGIAGITSFDNDIEKAGIERAEARDALGRVDVIHGEKKAQLTILEKQRADALRYREEKAHLDFLKAQLSVRLRDNAKASMDAQIKEADSISAKITELEAALAQRKQVQDETVAAIEAIDRDIEGHCGPNYTRAKSDLENAKVSLGTEKNVHDTKLEEASERDEMILELDEDLEAVNAEKAGKEEELASLKSDLESVMAERAEADGQKNRIDEDIKNQGGELTSVQTKIQALEKKIDDLSAANLTLHGESSSAKAVLDAAVSSKEQLEDTVEAAKFDEINAKGELDEVQASFGGTDVDEIGKEIFNLNLKEKELTKQEVELREIFNKKNSQYIKASAEKTATESVTGGGEAFNRILAAKSSGQIKGIHGAVCDLIGVESGYDTAISVAAGAKARAIVVDDDAVASACIRFLNENRLGRVTFLPLTKMQPGRPGAMAIQKSKQSLGYATKFITYKPEYANVVWYVFNDTLVCQDIDKARALMGGVRIVTKGGELLEKSGAMTGGTINTKALVKFGSAASGPSELTELAAEVEKARVALESASAALVQVREDIKDANARFRQANQEGAQGQGRIAAAKAKYEAAQKAHAKIKDDIKKAELAIADATAKYGEAKAKADESDGELEQLRGELAAGRDRVNELAPADLQQRIAEARTRSYDLSIKEGEVRSSIQGLSAEIDAINGRIAAIGKQKEKARADAESLRAEAASSEAKIAELAAQRDAMQSVVDSLEADQTGLRAQRDELMQKKYSLESGLENEKKDLEIQTGLRQSRLAEAEKSRTEYLAYQAEVDAIVGDVPTNPPSEDTLKRAIHGAEGALQALGNVNLSAVEQYDDTLKTIQFLEADIQRLNDQIDGLNKLEEEIKAKKKGIFMESYNAIETNFKALFTELSGGGEASMSLENPDDPFAGGLFINAKPRNGTMLRLEALSGGEKSLTALSFIFAIQEYQPSPFYVLDEVDMFLDAVNTELVAAHIKTQSGHTQFIQVSLRKVALTKADHLIGVTRPPSGISKIISQDLIDMSSLDKLEEEAQRRQREAEVGPAVKNE